MTISATMVRELREKTNAGMMDCKKALEECSGDFEQAIDWLRKKGLSSAAKKAGRLASEGVVEAQIHSDGRVGVLVEVNSETDFVARNDGFRSFVRTMATHIAKAQNPERAAGDEVNSGLLEQSYNGAKVGDALREAIAKIGENLVIRRFCKFEIGKGKSVASGAIESYIHGEGRIGVLVEVETKSEASTKKPEFKEFARSVAMHIAATNPMAVTSAEIPADAIAREKDVLTAKNKESGKKEEMIPKIVEGQIKKWFSEVCLVDQPFVKNPDQKVSDYMKEASAKLGEELKIHRFVRFELGEGLEKRSDNFAEEVAAQVKKG